MRSIFTSFKIDRCCSEFADNGIALIACNSQGFYCIIYDQLLSYYIDKVFCPASYFYPVRIQAFKFNESSGNITFILADRDGNLHQEKYVDGQNGFIYVGRIRKITNTFGKLTAGTKIKCKEAGIPHFPMKDVNIIIGFITDTDGPDPLVLCSNCCTLWYSDVLSKFQKITMKAKKWASLKHAPIDVSKIKYQAGDLVQGDLGISYTYDVPVSELIMERVILSLPLAVLSMILSTLIAIPLGIIAASNHTKPLDFLVMIFSQLGIAIPNFWFALLLIIFFSVFMGVLPAGGFAGWDAGIIPALSSLLLPTIALALPQAAILTRVTRSSLLEVLNEDYIRTARAKGSSSRRTLWRHALRNAMIPVVTIMGLQFSFLLAGTIIIENVFYLPGIGRLIFQAIAQRDLIVVKNLVILLAASVIVINFIVDMLYAVIDPRLRGAQNG